MMGKSVPGSMRAEGSRLKHSAGEALPYRRMQGTRRMLPIKGSDCLEYSVEELQDTPLFAGIGKEELRAVLQCVQAYPKKVSRGEYLAFEQQEVKSIGVVLTGCVHMVKEDVWGNSTILAVMHPR